MMYSTDIRERAAERPFIRFNDNGSEEFASEPYHTENSLERQKTQEDAVTSYSRNALTGVEIEELFNNPVAFVSDQLDREDAEMLKRRP